MSKHDDWIDALNQSLASMKAPLDSFSKAAKELSDLSTQLIAQAFMIPERFWKSRQRYVMPKFRTLKVEPMKVGMPTMRQEIEIEIDGEIVTGWLIAAYSRSLDLVIEHRNHRAVFYTVDWSTFQLVQSQLHPEFLPPELRLLDRTIQISQEWRPVHRILSDPGDQADEDTPT